METLKWKIKNSDFHSWKMNLWFSHKFMTELYSMWRGCDVQIRVDGLNSRTALDPWQADPW